MTTRTIARPRFAAAPHIDEPMVGGVWDRRDRCWALPPRYAYEAAQRIAATMVDAHEAGAADAPDGGAHRGMRFVPSVKRDPVCEAWGVWNRHEERWADRPCFLLRDAQEVTDALNAAYAAGLAEARIRRFRRK